MAKLKDKYNEWKQAQDEVMAFVEARMLSLEKKFKDTGNVRVDSVDFKKILQEQLNEKKLGEK